MKVAIVIGHGPSQDKGAVNETFSDNELSWNRVLARLIAEQLLQAGKVDPIVLSRVIERVQPVKQTNATDADFAVELHLNAYNGKASGTEMIHHPQSSRGMQLASLLQRAAVNVLRLPDRGVKLPQGGGRGSSWLAKTKMPAVIVESFFIDNDSDYAVGTERRIKLANSYARALEEFATILK